MAKSGNSKFVRRAFAPVLAFALACLVASPAAAAYRQACWVKYRVFSGDHSRTYSVDEWSPAYAVVCNYWTGMELNERAGADRYHGSRTYVAIAFGGYAQRIIRISESVGCFFDADPGCAETVSRLLHGRDEEARYWRGRQIRSEWLICQPGLGSPCERF